ncbi:hypothetical protein MS3_00001231 [Schistosoma haematobium]|uniref:Uncharacterized protein n=1 Tax=Schistosoma haematobium TaxID=6185 RepID=A0A922LRC9_SCHHA|nr:hypothetical protein MS3_00001231 [Schistosoma haematobium]KAH9591968.1 hypothetical protein MS3_00001231 [Schistosoma haematobium]
MTQFGFFNVCPIHFQHPFLISYSSRSWSVLSRSRLLLMVSGQQILSIWYRQLFINTCTFLLMVVVVLQITATNSRTVLTFVLKILTVVLVDSCFEFHMFFNCENVVLAMPIFTFTSASDPPCSSMMLPRYVKVSITSKASPLNVIALVLSVLYLRILVFPLCRFRHTNAEATAIMTALTCICLSLWDRRISSSSQLPE